MDRLQIGEAISGGFIVFGLCALIGVRLLVRGIRGDVLDASGTPMAGRGWFVAGGIILVALFAGWLVFVWKQGYFSVGADAEGIA
ncbi:MAG TPA: hypothetical protein VHE81_16195 [Lacipirellulaceae bacterium]|nr:hypothetical protein [Lacipirellulaceae bacterium]